MVVNTPENRARQKISKLLTAAGWNTQNRPESQFNCRQGVVLHGFLIKVGFTPCSGFWFLRQEGAYEYSA